MAPAQAGVGTSAASSRFSEAVVGITHAGMAESQVSQLLAILQVGQSRITDLGTGQREPCQVRATLEMGRPGVAQPCSARIQDL